jgi:hypothetical protein
MGAPRCCQCASGDIDYMIMPVSRSMLVMGVRAALRLVQIMYDEAKYYGGNNAKLLFLVARLCELYDAAVRPTEEK